MPGLTSDAGAERSLVALAPALLDSGVQLHLALLTDRQTLVPRLRELGVVVHDLSPSKGLLGRVRALKRTAETISPALIHATPLKRHRWLSRYCYSRPAPSAHRF